MDGLASAVDGLHGAMLLGVGRTLDVVEVTLRGAGGEVCLRVQCPFRITRGDRILLGSDDMRWLHPSATHAHLAFDRYETMFDAGARMVTQGWAPGVSVVAAVVGPAGRLTLHSSDDLHLDVCPAVSGPVECWRLGDHIWPPSA